jgi:glycerophosphoryl diester phosphodiesterase
MDHSRLILSSPTPLVFAHRGGARLAPENTLAALERGMATGADGFECDVQLSRDGVPVLIHDRTLDRTTDRTGPVGALTAAELESVDAAFAFADGGAFPLRGQGIGVPPLERVLRRFPGARTIIELKQGGPELARAVIDVLRRTDAMERVCVGSFHRSAIEVMRQEARQSPRPARRYIDPGSAGPQEVRARTARSRCPRSRAVCASSRPPSSGKCTARARPYKSGSSIGPRT